MRSSTWRLSSPRPTSSSTWSGPMCSSRSTCRSASSSGRSASSTHVSRGRDSGARRLDRSNQQRHDALTGAAEAALAIRDVARGQRRRRSARRGIVCRPDRDIASSRQPSSCSTASPRGREARRECSARRRSRARRRGGGSTWPGSGIWWSDRSSSTTLIALADERFARSPTTSPPVGPLHDAAEVQRHVPTVICGPGPRP